MKIPIESKDETIKNITFTNVLQGLSLSGQVIGNIGVINIGGALTNAYTSQSKVCDLSVAPIAGCVVYIWTSDASKDVRVTLRVDKTLQFFASLNAGTQINGTIIFATK